MDTIRTTIHRYFDNGYTCVFPNETGARFWLADYALNSERGAIRSDRAVSWDTFRKQFLPRHDDRRPASTLIRQLFITQFLQNPHSEPLHWFAPLNYPEANERFSTSIAAILPQLSVVDDELISKLPDEMVHDLRILKEAYTNFLIDHQLFEPAYESPSLDYAAEDVAQKGPYCILFPQTILDCDKLLFQLGDPDWITTFSIDSDAETGPCLEVFDNQLQELRTQLRRIAALLEQGVPTHDIVITCAKLEDFQDVLQEEAKLREIPIRIVQGLSPLQYPAGRFFRALKRVYDEQASLDSMKALLLDPCYPWRDLPLHRRLIAKAIELRIDHGDLRNFKGNDQWSSRLYRIDTDLSQWYDSLKKNIRNICTVSTIEMLREQLNQFQDTFFCDEQWNHPLETVSDSPYSARINPDADVYSFCMKRIDLLSDALTTGGFSECQGLFGIFLSLLEDSKYVPQQEQRGIAVYAWPLTAGMLPRYHFAMNLFHNAVQTIQCRANFIPETIGDETLRGETDQTAEVLALYRQIDEQQGGGTYLSCSRQTYSEVVLSPSWFVEHGRTCHPDMDISQAPDQFVAENDLWKGNEPRTPVCVHENQKKWFDLALRNILSQSRKTSDMARYPLKDVTMLRPLYSMADGKAVLPLSSTSLDLFNACPFAWACRYLYSLEEEEFTVPPVDHRAIGNFLHSAYQRFFQTVTEKTAIFDPDELDSYRSMLAEIWEDEFKKLSNHIDTPSASTLAWIRYSYEEQVFAILSEEAKTYPNTRSWGYEYKLEEQNPDQGYRLEGRIDRILLLEPTPEESRPSGNPPECPPQGRLFAVVDYKKGKAIGPITFSKQMHNQRFASSQLPVYRRLMRSRLDATVASGSYYSIADGRYSQIWGPSAEEYTAQIDTLLDATILNMLKKVEKGELMATPSKESCANCPFRQVCRRRFSIQ